MTSNLNTTSNHKSQPTKYPITKLNPMEKPLSISSHRASQHGFSSDCHQQPDSWKRLKIKPFGTPQSWPLTSKLLSQRGTRQAPECLVPGHIPVRLWEVLKAEKRHFYRYPPFARTGPRVFSTYNTVGRREAIVSTCSPLLNRFMIKVSSQYAVHLVGQWSSYFRLYFGSGCSDFQSDLPRTW